MNHDDPTYHKHMVTVRSDPQLYGSNFRLECTCPWYSNLASLSDVHAAELALKHVREAQPAAIFRRTGSLSD